MISAVKVDSVLQNSVGYSTTPSQFPFQFGKLLGILQQKAYVTLAFQLFRLHYQELVSCLWRQQVHIGMSPRLFRRHIYRERSLYRSSDRAGGGFHRLTKRG
jgi:hypothetical protein